MAGVNGPVALAVGVLLLSACAQVRDPQGGPVDTVPPLLVGSDPSQGSLNSTPSTILLQFSEMVKLDRVRDKMVVSPPMDPLPDVRSDGRSTVRITLRAPLKPNTTYTIDLSDAVVDVTEGNRCANARFVFATGPVLDSLYLSGSVMHAFTTVMEKDVLVIVHPADSAENIRKARPLWMARTDANGAFRIDHLPPGRYALFGLRDKNGNQRYDLPTEEVAFNSGPIELPVDTVPVRLRLFQERSKQQQVTSTRVTDQGAWQMGFSRPMVDPLLVPLDWEGGRLQWATEMNTTQDTLLFWPSDTTLLSGRRFIVQASGTPLDTLTYRLRAKVPHHVNGVPVEDGGTDPGIRVIETSRPLATLNPQRFQLLVPDQLELTPPQVDSLGLRRIRVTTTLKPGERATLLILPKAIQDTWGGANDTLRIPVGEPAEEDLGTLAVVLGGLPVSNAGLILHLVNAQDRVVRRTTLRDTSTPITWTRLQPGTYRIWLLEDANGNGRWDTGSMDDDWPPEYVWRDPRPIIVRAGWDMRVNWDLPR
ncbi:MAG: Ig-like domain-containing protein [Flavobacteriales bacterium]|nr:Ig-like domain-containing protein [Flavobacteriales bacterium]